MALKPFINEVFNGAIWRMEIDEVTDTLFLETRDNAQKQVSFSAADLTRGIMHFKHITTPERWLSGIEAAYDSVLLLHFYESADAPVHKGLAAIDAYTGKELWSNFAIAFDHLCAEGPVVYDTKLLPRKLFVLDAKTGATRTDRAASIHSALNNNIIVPELLPANQLPPMAVNLQPYGNSVHYLEYNNYRIVSLHTLQDGKLAQVLYIMDGAGVVFTDILNADIQKFQPEAFIIHKHRLVCIKNRSVLQVLTL